MKPYGNAIIISIALLPNEDYSWGGSFNTSAKKKTATITMKLTYEID